MCRSFSWVMTRQAYETICLCGGYLSMCITFFTTHLPQQQLYWVMLSSWGGAVYCGTVRNWLSVGEWGQRGRWETAGSWARAEFAALTGSCWPWSSLPPSDQRQLLGWWKWGAAPPAGQMPHWPWRPSSRGAQVCCKASWDCGLVGARAEDEDGDEAADAETAEMEKGTCHQTWIPPTPCNSHTTTSYQSTAVQYNFP